jgi:hypothetical protein
MTLIPALTGWGFFGVNKDTTHNMLDIFVKYYFSLVTFPLVEAFNHPLNYSNFLVENFTKPLTFE